MSALAKYDVVDIPFKGGQGVVANQSIAAGECISAESEVEKDYTTRFKFNHSCTPNAQSRSDVKGQSTRYVHALSKIEPGEEITISYIPTTMLFARRKEELQAKFDFACDCQVCQEGAERDVREVRLAACIKLFDKIPLAMQARCPTEALRQAHTRMDLLMHARCSSIEVAQAASDVMQMAAATGNQNAFTSSARFTYECRLLALGQNAAETNDARRMLDANWPPMPNTVPHVPVEERTHICAFCGKEGAKSNCPICALSFCGKDCQTQAWPRHKLLMCSKKKKKVASEGAGLGK